MMRREFSKALKVEMIRRASDSKGNIYCEMCGLNVRGKRIEFDHIIPEAMRLPHEMATPLTSADGQLLGADCCHRSPDGKTAKDLADIAEAKRREALHLGIPSASRLRGAGFRPSRAQRSASRTSDKIMPRRIGGEPS